MLELRPAGPSRFGTKTDTSSAPDAGGANPCAATHATTNARFHPGVAAFAFTFAVPCLLPSRAPPSLLKERPHGVECPEGCFCAPEKGARDRLIAAEPPRFHAEREVCDDRVAVIGRRRLVRVYRK